MIILLYILDFDCYEFVFISEDSLLFKKRLLVIKKNLVNELLFL